MTTLSTEQVEGLTRERDEARRYSTGTWASQREADYYAVENARLRAEDEKMREDCETYKASMKSYFEQTVRLGLAKGAAESREKRLREAMEPFSDISGEGDEDFPDDTKVVVTFGRSTVYTLKLGDFRRARAALSNTSEGGVR